MHVHVDVAVEPAIEAERGGPRTGIGQRGLTRLAHHVAEFSRQLQLALARQHTDLDGEQLTAGLGPRQSVRHPDARAVLERQVGVALRPERGGQLGRADDGGAHERSFRFALRHLAAQARQLALEVSHAGLTRPAVHQVAQRLVGDLDVFRFETCGGTLFGQQEALGDLDLLRLEVAGQPDDLHAVRERRRDRAERVRGADEHDLRQVEVHLEVVVVERVVLLGVEHLEQRARWVAAPVGAELVDLVEQEHRVSRARTAQALDDAPRHGADVRAAVAADLRFVTHAAERDADEAPAERARDGLAERGLAHAGRPHEAQDRRLVLARELQHRQVLDQALLHLLQAEVVLVQHLLHVGDVEVVARHRAPRQCRQPVDVAAHHGRLGRHEAHACQPFEFLHGLGAHLARHFGFADGLLKFVQLVGEFVLVAELFADRLQLLVEIELLLVLVHLRADLAFDLAFETHDLEFGRQRLGQEAQPDGRVGRLEQALLHRHLHQQVRGDGV